MGGKRWKKYGGENGGFMDMPRLRNDTSNHHFHEVRTEIREDNPFYFEELRAGRIGISVRENIFSGFFR